MRRKTYKTAVQWIADNDEPTLLDDEEVSNLISVQLVAEIYSKDCRIVAIDVVTERIKAKGNTEGA